MSDKTQNSRSFRIISDLSLRADVEEMLESEGFRFEPEPFSPFCKKLTHEPFPLGSSLAAFFGYIYIQDRSSMLPPLALAPEPGSSILDVCASPGSKSGLLAQLTGPGGFVLANEPNRQRHATLAANLRNAQLFHAATSSHTGETLPLAPGSWTHILLDPPCSGWGTVKKNPAAGKIWQGDKIAPLIRLQRKLLRKASELLSPGGRLIYSTCTTNGAENEEQTQFAINELGLEARAIPPFPGFVFDSAKGPGLTVDGDASAAQGFYLSLLIKPGAREEPARACGNFRLKNELDPAMLENAAFDPAKLPEGKIALFNNTARFLPAKAFQMLPEGFYWQGYALGKFTGGHFQPYPKMPSLLPPQDRHAALILNSPLEIRKLLSGAALAASQKDSWVGLWHKNLPLGACQIKNGRVIARFR